MSTVVNGLTQKQATRLLVIIVIGCMVEPLIWAVQLACAPRRLYPDFFALWSFGHYVFSHNPATIYNSETLHKYQTGFGMPDRNYYPFLYPPIILLFLTPFGALPYLLARYAWLLITGGAYIAAFGIWRWPRWPAAIFLLAPTTTLCAVVGQNGLLTGALMGSGLRLLNTRPFLAGAVLGGLVYKPQMTLLVPFYLVFGGHWRAFAGAAFTAIMLAGASTICFGSAMWVDWADCIGRHESALVAGQGMLLPIMPTVTSAVLLLGGGSPIAHAAQDGSSLFCLLAIWRCRMRYDVAARAVLPLATILAAPYALDYDLPIVTGAVLAVLADSHAQSDLFDRRCLFLLLACVIAPIILIARLGAVSAAVPVVFAATLFVLCRQDRAPAISPA
jgi:hypothetical protein